MRLKTEYVGYIAISRPEIVRNILFQKNIILRSVLFGDITRRIVVIH
jgi:hypothetical protein